MQYKHFARQHPSIIFLLFVTVSQSSIFWNGITFFEGNKDKELYGDEQGGFLIKSVRWGWFLSYRNGGDCWLIFCRAFFMKIAHFLLI